MDNLANDIMLPEETIISKIYLIRGKKVILDRDLAEFCGLETRRLNEDSFVFTENFLRMTFPNSWTLTEIIDQVADQVTD